MLLFKKVDVADNELGLLFVNERFSKVLEPGRHRILRLRDKLRVEKYDVTQHFFVHENAKFLLKKYPEKFADYILSYELSDQELGLLYKDKHFVEVVKPGSFVAVFKDAGDTSLKTVDISENYVVNKDYLDILRDVNKRRDTQIADAVLYAEVPNEHVGLLYVNGALQEVLRTGSYGFFKYNRSILVKLVDLRLQSVDVSGQEILTKDRVSLRINLTGSYKVLDAEKAALKVNDYTGFIYRELQLSLREAVGAQTLDSLLEDKDKLNHVIVSDVAEKLAQYGIKLLSVGVKDIILPGDMKVILNQVVEAQKEAEANLIKRKEETQAMRSLHNTAKVMENNPIILRLKELESLERISGRIDKISVYGGLDGVMNDLVKLSSASK